MDRFPMLAIPRFSGNSHMHVGELVARKDALVNNLLDARLLVSENTRKMGQAT